MATVFCSLGSNLGDREKYLSDAAQLLSETGPALILKSSIYETEPVGKTDQPEFLNAIVHIESELSPQDFLAQILETEKKLGRVRSEKWGPRTIDIDVILFDNLEIDEPNLTIPHPRFAERRFVLEPMNELAPHLVVPGLNKSIAELLETCGDQTRVIKYIPQSIEWI